MAAVLEEKTSHSLKELTLLALVVGSSYFLLSLFTYNSEDAGWTHSSAIQSVGNAGGFVGAWLADICLSFFGVVGFLLPLLIIRHAYLMYIRKLEPRRNTLLILHWSGAILTITASAALFYLHVLRVGIELPGNTGGIIGQEIGDRLLLLCGNSGATLLLIAALLSGITLTTQLSWLKALELIGKYSVLLFDIVGKAVFDFFGFLQAKSEQIPVKASMQAGLTTTLRSVPSNLIRKSSLDREKSKPEISTFDSVSQEKPKMDLSFPNNITSTILSPGEKLANQPIKQSRPSIRHTSGEVLPKLDLLDNRDTRVKGYTQSDLEEMSRLVEDILADFNVTVGVVGFLPGPVITRFEIQPAAGVKVSRISSLSKDLARALSVTSVRIVEVIPGNQ